jgi:alpha-L-arabinofuranosidase
MGRKGGLRADMVQMLADLKPGFIRFPGGCIVEGHDLSNRYQWKKTIGPVEQRALKINRWNFEFGHRPAPDYFQTFGLGFFEYFQLAEDIGAAPLPILNCGMACQFNSAELVPLDQLEPYIQDALDLIEFANGDATTTWGAKRVEMGHTKPFRLKMLGVGNENWGPQYLERLELFKKAIHAKYPYIKIIGSSGTDPEGERFEELNAGLRKMGIDFIDEHYYRKPGWFFANAGRYDRYPRTGPKIFAGEYAGHDEKITEGGPQKSTWRAALAEAAFLTGLERNADVVHLASYAPLFGHIDGWQWSPNLIWVNNLKVMSTPEYHVQKLFSTNKGTHIAKVTCNGDILAGNDSLYASAVQDTIGRQLIVKVANAKQMAEQLHFTLPASIHQAGLAYIHQMHSTNLLMHNSLDNPYALQPQSLQKAFAAGQLSVTIPPYSFSVIKIPWQ